MGQILFSGGNGSLVSSDELTANTNYVLDGKTYMGLDTDDEAGTGSMPNIASIDYGPSLAVSGSNLYCRMNNGAHIENASSGYPEVAYSLDKVRSAINYTDASKVLNDTTICGMTGTMLNQGTWNSSVGVNSSVTIPRGYHSGSGKVNNSVSTMGGQTITPSSSAQTVYCSGKYMTGNITVNGTNIFRSQSFTFTASKVGYRSFYDNNSSKTYRTLATSISPTGFRSISGLMWTGAGDVGFRYSGGSGHIFLPGYHTYTLYMGSNIEAAFSNTYIEIPCSSSTIGSTIWAFVYGIAS